MPLSCDAQSKEPAATPPVSMVSMLNTLYVTVIIYYSLSHALFIHPLTCVYRQFVATQIYLYLMSSVEG